MQEKSWRTFALTGDPRHYLEYSRNRNVEMTTIAENIGNGSTKHPDLPFRA